MIIYALLVNTFQRFHWILLRGIPMPSSWRRQWHPTPVLLPGKSRGRRSLVDCCLWGCIESDMTERLHFHFSLSCTGEGNGNPLQCSFLPGESQGRRSLVGCRLWCRTVGHDWSAWAACLLPQQRVHFKYYQFFSYLGFHNHLQTLPKSLSHISFSGNCF